MSLMEDGLVRFAGISPSADVVRAGLVLVTPTLAVARQLMDQGVDAHAIIVDGYERPHQGRENETLDSAPRSTAGELRCTERLGGLLKHYARAA